MQPPSVRHRQSRSIAVFRGLRSSRREGVDPFLRRLAVDARQAVRHDHRRRRFKLLRRRPRAPRPYGAFGVEDTFFLVVVAFFSFFFSFFLATFSFNILFPFPFDFVVVLFTLVLVVLLVFFALHMQIRLAPQRRRKRLKAPKPQRPSQLHLWKPQLRPDDAHGEVQRHDAVAHDQLEHFGRIDHVELRRNVSPNVVHARLGDAAVVVRRPRGAVQDGDVFQRDGAARQIPPKEVVLRRGAPEL
mmetsp:Transcript_6065/g.19386  ORF Transcript_6065/g.19386 Transcript_6065/m.19386 type:complete len:244 (-) Transcript_6065:2621-3352(-)